MLSALRKAIVLTGLTLIISQADASITTLPYNQIEKDIEQELAHRRKNNLVRENTLITYEEWKATVEYPDSSDAKRFRTRSNLILADGKTVYDSFKQEEKQDFDRFWKTFDFDIVRARENSKQNSETFMQYTFPVLVDLQTDLDQFYGHHFNFSYPSKGEQILIMNHIRFGFKYAAEGKTRKTYLGRKFKL